LNEPTLLVVEDDAEMRGFLKKVLATEGMSVLTAATGDDGIQQAITNKPDLILLDLRMPAPDGVAVCKAIRTNKKTEHIPILVITGSTSREEIEGSMTAGADDLVCKPIDVQDLCLRVRALLKCKDIADPVERHQHYGQTVRQMTEERLPPTRLGGK
jgi:DNA-binding response OmpR family regulator